MPINNNHAWRHALNSSIKPFCKGLENSSCRVFTIEHWLQSWVPIFIFTHSVWYLETCLVSHSTNLNCANPSPAAYLPDPPRWNASTFRCSSPGVPLGRRPPRGRCDQALGTWNSLWSAWKRAFMMSNSKKTDRKHNCKHPDCHFKSWSWDLDQIWDDFSALNLLRHTHFPPASPTPRSQTKAIWNQSPGA